MVRTARNGRGLTQAQLAAAAGLSLNTINRLENGLFPDLGLNKVQAILEKLDMKVSFNQAEAKPEKPDFLGMASASAGVSFKSQLTANELKHALLAGNVTPGKEAHFIVLLEESPAPLLKGLVQQVGAWVKAGKVENNLRKIADQVGLDDKNATWPAKIA